MQKKGGKVLANNKKVIHLNPNSVKKIRENQNRPSIFERNSNDAIKTTSVKNVVVILQRDKYLKNMFKFNEFTHEVDVVEDCTIKTDLGNIVFTKGQYTDQIIFNVELYIESNSMYEHSVFKNNVIDQGIINYAHMHSYNPIIDYMNEAYLNWDEKRRLDDFFPTFLGVEKNETNTLIARLFFMGVVAKALDPKTKFDYVLDLVGGQGVGKTTLLQKIAPLGAYTDQFNSFTNKDDFEVMKNALIVNDDEMTASNQATFEEIKKFITIQLFEFRKPYARKSERFLKGFVLVRTTNEIRHLKDKSGDRRFISLYASNDRQKLSPVTDLHADYVKQLWGEAMWIYKNTKNPFKLNQHQLDLLEANRDQFRYTTGLEDELMDVLENNFKDREFITNDELAVAVLGDQDALSRNSKESRDIRYYMEHAGYEVGKFKKINNKSFRGFYRKKSQ